ncbi:hypothetical protein BaRGS_00035428 [Batillaria attramentaria]|uniref:Uncharacterized protein n=1 Tax=Batillaria attramentaria TaxID=370345 RepID=A0ABD0JEW9_9CAEN
MDSASSKRQTRPSEGKDILFEGASAPVSKHCTLGERETDRKTRKLASAAEKNSFSKKTIFEIWVTSFYLEQGAKEV